MRIALIGAYGFTGSIICNELASQKLSIIAMGKNQELLHHLQNKYACIIKTILVDISTKEGIETVLLNSDLIINCAGPFVEESLGICNAVARSGKIYLDICGELEFVKNSFTNNNENAKLSGATLIHSCAFESLPMDLVLNIISEKFAEVKELRSFYSFAHSRPSPGTRLTMKLARFRNALKINEGRWMKSDYKKDRLSIEWSKDTELTVGVPYPLPDVVFSEWKYKPLEASSYLLLSKEASVFMDPTRYDGLPKSEIIAKHKKNKLTGPSESERSLQQFNLVVCVKGVDNKLMNVLIKGSDMYLCTAKAIGLTVKAILESKEIPKGVRRPAEFFKGWELDTLKELGLEMNEVFDFKFI